MVRRQQAVCGVAVLFSAMLLGAEASARTETLRWTQVQPPAVAGFRVHWRTAGADANTEDIGLLSPDAQGVYTHSVVVDDAADVYFTMTAYDSDGLSSFPSNEICRGPGVPCASGGGSSGGGTGGSTGGDTGGSTGGDTGGSTGGDTGGSTGGSTGGTALGAITGFKLWNASSDTVIDNNFQNGESIQATQYPCVAIEILGNSYLMNSANPGSVKRQLDSTGGSCTTPGVTHENSPPYAWEADEGPGKFACAPSLRTAGSHTLTVTPFDGDDCTGNQGSSVTLQFQVTTPLGVPGQPVLVQ